MCDEENSAHRNTFAASSARAGYRVSPSELFRGKPILSKDLLFTRVLQELGGPKLS
jgi:hypothetical protein